MCVYVTIIYLFLACVGDLYHEDKIDLAEESVSDVAVSNEDIITSLLEKPFSRLSDFERSLSLIHIF